MVVVVKTEDQACGGSLPFYPFIEGTFCALGLAGGGEGLGSSWEVEEPAWLVDLLGYRFLALDSSRPDPTNSTQAPGRRSFAILPFYFQMNRSIKGTARKPCPCWSREQSRVSGWLSGDGLASGSSFRPGVGSVFGMGRVRRTYPSRLTG